MVEGSHQSWEEGILYIAFFNEERPLPYEEERLFAVALRFPYEISVAKCLIHMVKDQDPSGSSI